MSKQTDEAANLIKLVILGAAYAVIALMLVGLVK